MIKYSLLCAIIYKLSLCHILIDYWSQVYVNCFVYDVNEVCTNTGEENLSYTTGNQRKYILKQEKYVRKQEKMFENRKS